MSSSTLSRIRGAARYAAVLATAAACHVTGTAGPAAGPTPDAQVEAAAPESSAADAGRSRSDPRTSQYPRAEQATRMEELLVGRYPGVEVRRSPDGGMSIRIRGGSTLSGSGEPLYLVDGVEVFVAPGRGLDWLNPADIADIEVLKDATSTTMYGVRGANGVIRITTKRSR